MPLATIPDRSESAAWISSACARHATLMESVRNKDPFMLDLPSLRAETEVLRAIERLRADLTSLQRGSHPAFKPRPCRHAAEPSRQAEPSMRLRTFHVDPDAVSEPSDEGRQHDARQMDLPFPDPGR